MYTQFFGLNEKPFAITPDPRYLFMSERHGEGLAHLLYGVTDSGGFIQLTGEVGTGKTTLIRSLLSQLPSEVDVALILNPQVTVIEFLQAICRELNIDPPAAGDSAMALVDTLNRFLLDAHARGRRIILLVDEAQNLSAEVLEQLRLLTNLETARQKLLQIILIGQPELRDILAQNHLRQLAQRVTGRYHLEPLSREESAQYIDHRMKVAGGLGDIFTDAARREVFRLSGGIPRIMNVICDRALLGAYSQEKRAVDAALVRAAAREVSGSPRRAPQKGWIPGLAAAAVFVAAALWLITDNRQVEPASEAGRAAEATTPADTTDAPAMASANEATLLRTASAAPMPAVETRDEPRRPSLGEQLTGIDRSLSLEDAVNQLLSLWSVDAGSGAACRRAEASGLSCLTQRGSLGLLLKLNRPAVLTLTDNNGRRHRALLLGADGDRVKLGVGNDEDWFGAAELADTWFGQYTLLWRPPTGSARSLKPGMRDAGVAWLRGSLDTLEGKEPDADSADSQFFDEALETRVRQFQQSQRLEVDGLAGQQTQIIINGLLAADDAPRLSGDR